MICSTKIEVKPSLIAKAGRGIFAKKDIRKNEVIEDCPVLVIPKKDYHLLKKTILHNYYFMWGKINCGICLGFGSLYNHSYEPNATYKKDIKKQTIKFTALKQIKKGEEITVNYNYGNADDKKKLWIKNITG